MKNLISGLGLVLLAGCVSPADLQKNDPVVDSLTQKTAREYARCLAPKWQDLNSDVASTETETGYRIRLDIDLVGTPAMALVDQASNGARVRVYLRNGTWSNWASVARSCI